jgi:hypothetical protein
MTPSLGMEVSPSFTVKFGKMARTLDYVAEGVHFVFTFDVASQGSGASLVLEHWASGTARGSGYAVAFERTRDFLLSRGYSVQIFGA